MSMESKKIADLISKQIEKYEAKPQIEEVGAVTEAGDGIVKIAGLSKAVAGEMLELPGGIYCLALNLDQHEIGGVILGESVKIQEGDLVKRTGKVLQVPVGEALVGRIVDPLGIPLDNKGDIDTQIFSPVEFKAPEVVERQPVREPLQTGIKAIDSMVPIGRGQRELIISDRRVGKTALLVDTILNQKGKDVYCIFVIIGQKTSLVARIAEKLEQEGAMDYTTIVVATAKETAALQYLAPYSGCAMGEYFMYNQKHAVVMYDDLSKHAVAYREISLLLRRPPGREAYPGDIFYLHSRLLERSAKLSDEKGAGSLTAIPVIEVKGGDISGYIPTNLISITDGQIYLDTELFNSGIRPAINAGISVSRVGGAAQIPAMKKVARMLRLDISQYREIETFAKFGTELDTETKKQVTRGERIVEVLKQGQYQPMAVEDQVIAIFALTYGYLDDIKVSDICRFEEEFLTYMHNNKKDIIKKIRETKDINQELEQELKQAVKDFKSGFSQ
ncbi:MAG: F0F1 ATP synthase subunit alpha [Actinomycetia bacterium]|nr:F0F1 ATP synthase subunit alpha [Actinomycetes bacterium]